MRMHQGNRVPIFFRLVANRGKKAAPREETSSSVHPISGIGRNT
jgi:hypothetical protein